MARHSVISPGRVLSVRWNVQPPAKTRLRGPPFLGLQRSIQWGDARLHRSLAGSQHSPRSRTKNRIRQTKSTPGGILGWASSIWDGSASGLGATCADAESPRPGEVSFAVGATERASTAGSGSIESAGERGEGPQARELRKESDRLRLQNADVRSERLKDRRWASRLSQRRVDRFGLDERVDHPGIELFRLDRVQSGSSRRQRSRGGGNLRPRKIAVESGRIRVFRPSRGLIANHDRSKCSLFPHDQSSFASVDSAVCRTEHRLVLTEACPKSRLKQAKQVFLSAAGTPVHALSPFLEGVSASCVLRDFRAMTSGALRLPCVDDESSMHVALVDGTRSRRGLVAFRLQQRTRSGLHRRADGRCRSPAAGLRLSTGGCCPRLQW